MGHPYRTLEVPIARRWRLRPRLRAWRKRRVIFFYRWVQRLREMDFDEAWRAVAVEIILLLTAAWLTLFMLSYGIAAVKLIFA